MSLNLPQMSHQEILALLDNLAPEQVVIIEQLLQRLSEQFKITDKPVKTIELQLVDGQRELLWQHPDENPPAKTELGQQLRQLRADIVASGEPLLDWEGVERAVKACRGERT